MENFISQIENQNKEHFCLIERLISRINPQDIHNILDCGSGKTSLSILSKYFPNENIDAIVYYDDQRKISSINEYFGDKVIPLEKDICKDNIDKEYDLVLAHLLLGECMTFGNSFEKIVESLFKIKTKYLIIMDYREDPVINYAYLEMYIKNNNYSIISLDEEKKDIAQQFSDFIGKTYVAYLIRK